MVIYTFADMISPKVGLLLVLAAATQLSSGLPLSSVGVEKCEPSIIPRSVSRAIHPLIKINPTYKIFVGNCIATLVAERLGL